MKFPNYNQYSIKLQHVNNFIKEIKSFGEYEVLTDSNFWKDFWLIHHVQTWKLSTSSIFILIGSSLSEFCAPKFT